MADNQEGAVRIQEVILQPFDRVDVQMRRGLVHDQQVAFLCLDNDPGEHDLGTLSSGEGIHGPVHELLGQTDLLQCPLLVVLVVHIAFGQLGFQFGALLGQGVPVYVASGHHSLLDLLETAFDVLYVAVRPSEDIAYCEFMG